jgi:translocation and assembly module TamB
VTEAELALFFNGKQVVLESFQGSIGGGSLKGSGKLEVQRYLPELVTERFGLVLDLAQAVFHYPEGLTSRLSGTVIFQGTPSDKALKGEIRIDRAAYEKRIELRSMVLDLRRAQDQVSQMSGDGTSPFFGDTQLDLHIVGNQNIWVNNNLAKFPIQVDLILRGTLDHPQLFGNLTAQDGTFTFRRNEFKVLSATADFISTDTIRPVLDIHAQTEIRTYRIDLRLTGTVERFNLALQSDPVLSETDILALLTLGQTASEVSEAKSEIGATEATVLLAGPLQERVEEEVQKVTGVDRFQVDPYYSGAKAAGGARLTVGKRLMEDRLYVTYTTALSTQEDLIKMEYLLGKNVLLVGERDENGRLSSDLKFRFEFR